VGDHDGSIMFRAATISSGAAARRQVHLPGVNATSEDTWDTHRPPVARCSGVMSCDITLVGDHGGQVLLVH